MRHVFIINPTSGKRDASVVLRPVIEAAAAAAGIVPQLYVTEAPKHAMELARREAQTGDAVRLYAVGGDGTLNEVFNGAWRHPNAQVACIPCGSGNDYLRTYGSEPEFLDLAAQLAGQAVSVDLMQVDGGICMGLTSTGLDAEVAYNIPKYRRVPFLGGSMAYNISILEKLLRPLGKTLKIRLDDEVLEGRFLIAAVCNAQYYGGGYHAAPMARPDDGVLEVILVKKVSRLLIANIISKYSKGRHVDENGVILSLRRVMWHRRCREIEILPTGNEQFILNVDGECGPAGRLYAKVLPGAGQFVLPAAVARRFAAREAAPAAGAEN